MVEDAKRSYLVNGGVGLKSLKELLSHSEEIKSIPSIHLAVTTELQYSVSYEVFREALVELYGEPVPLTRSSDLNTNGTYLTEGYNLWLQ